MNRIPTDGDPAWVKTTLNNLEELIKETGDAVEQYHQRLRYPDEEIPTTPEIPAEIAVIRKVLTRLLTQEGNETRFSTLRAVERAWPSSSAVIALSAAGIKPDFFVDLIKTSPDAKEVASATEVLCKMYSNSNETVSIIWDEAFMKASSEEEGSGPYAQRKKDLGNLLNGIFRILQERIQRSTDGKNIDAIMDIFPYLLGSFEGGGVRYLVEEGGITFFASYLTDLNTSVGVADAAATVFSFHLAGYQLSLHGADRVWDAIHASPSFYRNMVMQIRAYDDDDDRIDLQLQCLVVLRLLSLYPPKNTIPNGLNPEQALKLEDRCKSLIDAGAITLMKSIILGERPRPQAINILSNLSESRSANQAEIWDSLDASFFRRSLYDRGDINDGSALIDLFLKYIFFPENRKACLERGCLTPLRYHVYERDHAEATAKALLLIADFDGDGKDGTDIWDPMLVTPIGMFIGQAGGGWEWPILGLKLLKSIITFPGLSDEEKEGRRSAFIDLGTSPVVKFMLSRPVGEYPLLANAAADVYPLLHPGGLSLELKHVEGEENALKLSLGESVQALFTYHDEEVLAAGRLAVNLLLEDRPYKLLTDLQRGKVMAALAALDAASVDQKDDVDEPQSAKANIDETADPLRLLAHALLVPFTQYSTELVGVTLPLISIFLSPGPGLLERKKAFESGAALFLPSVFTDMEEPEPTFEIDFDTFNPNPVPRDPELPAEEEAEEAEMEITISSDDEADDKGDDETEEAQEDGLQAEEAAGAVEEEENEADDDAKCKSEVDGKDSDFRGQEKEDGAEEEKEPKEEDQDGSTSEKSGSDSDDDSDSNDELEIDNRLPQSAFDFLLAVRGAVLDPKADMVDWAGQTMRDILTSPIPAVVKAGITEFDGFYTRTWGGKQWKLIAKHGLVPILRDLLDHPDETMRPLLLLNRLGDSDAPRYFKKKTLYSPDLLDKLGVYLSVPSESGRYDTFQALEIIKGTYLECGHLDEVRQIRDKLQTLADQPSETEEGEYIHYPEAAKEILKETEQETAI